MDHLDRRMSAGIGVAMDQLPLMASSTLIGVLTASRIATVLRPRAT